MFEHGITPDITAEDLRAAYGEGDNSHFAGSVWRVLRPREVLQSELTAVLDQADRAGANLRTRAEIEEKKRSDADLAIREIVSELLTLSAEPGLDRVLKAIRVERNQGKPATPQEIVAAYSKRDPWSGEYWPAKLSDWCLALGLPPATPKARVITVLAEKFRAIRDAAARRRAERSLDGFSADAARLGALRTLAARGCIDPKALRCVAAGLAAFGQPPAPAS